MKLLQVPYIPQINANACGAAVLEMVYKYYGLDNITQQELMDEYQELEPHGSGNFRLTTDNLVLDARKRGFESEWSRADLESLDEVTALLNFLIDNKAPLIVCQKFTEALPLIGHFRIVVGIDNKTIYLHDPSSEIGGANLTWSVDKFLSFWQPTGANVTGGVFVIINR